MKISFAIVVALIGLLGGAWGCSAGHAEEPEASALPADIRADYLVFAQRCSKCHSLARPLNSGIDNDEFWKRYVERMRRQPASGISVADTVPILRFLHAFSVEQRKKKEQPLDVPLPGAAAPDGGLPPLTGAR